MRKKTSTQKLDEQGRIIEVRNLDQQGNQIDRMAISYNVQGKLLREVYYDGEGAVVLTHVYAYK